MTPRELQRTLGRTPGCVLVRKCRSGHQVWRVPGGRKCSIIAHGTAQMPPIVMSNMKKAFLAGGAALPPWLLCYSAGKNES